VTADLFVTVVAPLHNDSDIVEAFIDETLAVLRQHYRNYELVVVDDGSTDGTAALVARRMSKEPGLRCIRLSRTFGSEISIAAGIDSAIGDYVGVMLPADDPPECLPDLVTRCHEGAGIVFGIRKDRRGEPLLQRLGAAAFYTVLNRLFQLRIPRNSTHFRVMNRQAVNAITRIHDSFRYLRTLTDYVGYAPVSVPYTLKPRRTHPRRKSLGDAIALAIRILVSTSLRPLYLASWLALAACFSGIAFLVYVVAVYLVKDRVAEGWTTQAFVMTAMFSGIMLVLSVVAAYLGRVLDQTRDRPLYFVLDEQGAELPLVEAERKNIVTRPGDD